MASPLKKAAQGALRNLEKRDAPHGPNMPSERVQQYVDPPNERIDEWKWRPLPEIAATVPTEVPEHVLKFGDYMHTMSKKAGMEGFDNRDILKAYTDTLSSIQRTGRRRELLEGDGLKLSSDAKIIRPEGAFADWLGSPEGQKYLLYGSQGETHPDMVEDAVRKMHRFGLSDTLREQLTNAPQIVAQADPARISTLVDRASKMAGHPDEWRDVMEPFTGIGPAKGGFLAAILGSGHQPTLDARQVLLHTGQPTKESKSWTSGKRGDAAVDRLAARQAALDLYMPTQYEPERQHLTHHTFWDALEGQETTHKDMIDMMLNRAEGGPVPGFKKGGRDVPGGETVKGALRKLEDKDRPFHQKFEKPGALREPDLSLEEIINRAKDVNLIDRSSEYTGLPPEDLVKALRTVKPTVSNPDVAQRQGITNLMDPNAIRNARATIYDPEFNQQTPRIFDPSKLLGHNLTASMMDLTPAGPVVVKAGDYDFSKRPIITQGGGGFSDLNHHLWANADEGVATAIRNAVRGGGPDKPPMGDRDLPTLFMTNSMGLQSHDQSDMMMQGIEQMLKQSNITKPTAAEFDKFVRAYGGNLATRKDKGPFLPDFPGVNSPNLLEYLMEAPMANRAMLPKMMDKGAWNKRGVPNPVDLRMALTDPGMYNVPTHTPGRIVGEIDLDNLHGGDTLHGSYPQGLIGRLQGKLDRIMPWREMFPEFAAATADKPIARADRSFQLSPVVQVADQEWLDRVGPIWERAPKATWAEGGVVPGYAEGGESKYFPRMTSFLKDTVGDYVTGLPEAQDQWQRKKLWEDEGKSWLDKVGERGAGFGRILANNALSGAAPNLIAGARSIGSPKSYAELVNEETGKQNMASEAAGPYATAAATTLGGTLPFILGRGIPAAVMNWADMGRRLTRPAESVTDWAVNAFPSDDIQGLVNLAIGEKGRPGVAQYLQRDLKEGAKHMKDYLGLARGGALRGYLQGGDVAGGGGGFDMPTFDLGAGIVDQPSGVQDLGSQGFGIDDLLKMPDPGRKTPDPLKFAPVNFGGGQGGQEKKGGGIGSLLGPIGAIAGSFIPGVGTAIGGAIGGLAGQALAAQGGYVSDLAPPHGYAEGGKADTARMLDEIMGRVRSMPPRLDQYEDFVRKPVYRGELEGMTQDPPRRYDSRDLEGVQELMRPLGRYAEGGKVSPSDEELLAYHIMNFARGGAVPGFDVGGQVPLRPNSELWQGGYDYSAPKPLDFGGPKEEEDTDFLGGLLKGKIGGLPIGGLLPLLLGGITGGGGGAGNIASMLSPAAAIGKGIGLFADGGMVPPMMPPPGTMGDQGPPNQGALANMMASSGGGALSGGGF